MESLIYVKLLKDDAIAPYRKRPTDAGYDIRAYVDADLKTQPEEKRVRINLDEKYIEIGPNGARAIINTGLSVSCPPNMYLDIRSKSGNSVKSGLEVGAGIIDSGYRGQIAVVLYNHSDRWVKIKHNDKIAQIIPTLIYDIDALKFKSCHELPPVNSNNPRGNLGFGSSGYIE